MIIRKIFNTFLITIVALAIIGVWNSEAKAQTLDPNNPAGAPDPALLAQSGITTVRVVLKDEPATISYVQQLQANGIQVIGIVNWEYGTQGAYPSNQNDPAYAQFFAQNVIPQAYSQFGNLYAYQVWNEPDDTAMANTVKFMDPTAYGNLLNQAYGAIKDLNGNQIVFSAGLVSGNMDYLQGIVDGGGLADVFALHPYDTNPSDPAAIDRVKALIQSMTVITGKPIFITEFGWPTSDQQAQAAWLVQVMNLRNDPQLASYLLGAMWYAYSDGQNPGFGLLDANMQPKLAYFAYLEMLQGTPLTNADLLLLLSGQAVKCMDPTNGRFMGFAFKQEQCELYEPCKDPTTGIISGYAPRLPTDPVGTRPKLCDIQTQYIAACGGRIDLAHRNYRGDVVGHNGERPFNIDASLGQEILFNGQPEGTVLDKELAKVLTANLKIEAEYKHVDFEQISKRYTGSIDPNSPHYIENRIKLNKANTPNLIFNYRNQFDAGYGVAKQPFCQTKEGESHTECLKRLMGQTPDKNDPYGTSLGLDSDFQSLRFTGCIQRIGCNPKTETCLKADALNDPQPYCTAGDAKYGSPANCISLGQLIQFKGKIVYEEPTALHSTAYTYDTYLRDTLVKTGTDKKSNFKDLYTSNEVYDMNEKNLAFNDTSNPPVKNEIARTSYTATNYSTGSLTDPTQAQALEGQFDVTDPETLIPNASCDGRIDIEMVNTGTSFVLIGWDNRERDGGGTCEPMADWSLNIEYFLNGQPLGGCSLTQITGATQLPTREDPNRPGGLVLSDLGADGNPLCGVPIVPSSLKPGEKIEALVTIPTSNASDQNGCFKSAQCYSGAPKNVNTKPRVVDCRVCPSWAPASVCAQIIGTSIIDNDECVDGNCVSSVALEGGGSSAAAPMHGPSGFSISNWLYETFGGWFGSATGLTGGNCQNITGSRQDTDANNVPIFNPDGSAKLVDYTIGVKCRFNARHYNLYVYPTVPIPGDFGKRATDMEVNNVLSSIGQWTDKYFKPEANKTSVKLKLNIPAGGFKAFTNTGEEVLADKKTSTFNTWTNGLLDFSASDVAKDYLYVGCKTAADCTRNMHVEFKYFVQPQASGYCLTEKFLTMKQGPNNQIPKSLSDSHLCDTFPFIPGNDGKSRMAMDPELLKITESAADAMQTELTQTFVLDQDQVEKDISTKMSAIENDSKNIRYANILKNSNEIDNPTKIEDRIVLLAQSLTEKQREQLNKELQRDIEIAITKNVQFMKPTDPDYLSPQLKYDLEKVRDKYIEKVLQLSI